MRKRVDHDATQEVSSSQLVPDAKPPVFTGPKNDASMWLQAPVSADDFVRAAKKQSRFSARTAVIALGTVALVGVTAAGVWYGLLREPSIKSASLSGAGSAGSSSSTPTPEPPSEPAAASASDAGVAEVAKVPADAAVVVAADAGVAAVDALQVDAISAADPAVVAKKKPTKKRPAKKKVTKKKTAKRR